MVPRSRLPVYARQLFPETVIGEKPADRGTTVFEDEGVRMWHQGDRIAIVSFKSKMHALGARCSRAESRIVRGRKETSTRLVTSRHECRPSPWAPTSRPRIESIKAGQFDEFERWSRSSSRLAAAKYALVPTVAAVRAWRSAAAASS
jgi:3-hydroxyacyl-CoA dehydrogenase